MHTIKGKAKRYSVNPGNIVNVDYEIEVISGIMSLGALNTNRNGWYASEDNATAEIICKQGRYDDTVKWVVPENETEFSLVLRNYQLDKAEGSAFIIHRLKMAIENSASS